MPDFLLPFVETLFRVGVLGLSLFVAMNAIKERLAARAPGPWTLRLLAVALGSLAGIFVFPRELELGWRVALGGGSGAACTFAFAALRARAKGLGGGDAGSPPAVEA